jgi:hypothetical protein
MLADAPGLFSTTTLWPKISASCTESKRATLSTAPPGAKPTNKRIGLSEDDCAFAEVATAEVTAAPAAARKKRLFFMELPLVNVVVNVE